MLGPEIAAYLASHGYGTVNTNIFYDMFPADPSPALCVLGYGGEADEPDLGAGGTTTRLEFARFQVVHRGIRGDSDGPQLQAIQARATLVAVLNVTLSGVRYVGIDCLGPPFNQGENENQCPEWSVSYRAMKAPSTS